MNACRNLAVQASRLCVCLGVLLGLGAQAQADSWSVDKTNVPLGGTVTATFVVTNDQVRHVVWQCYAGTSTVLGGDMSIDISGPGTYTMTRTGLVLGGPITYRAYGLNSGFSGTGLFSPTTIDLSVVSPPPPPPVANFTIAGGSSAPCAETFTSTSTGSITSLSWSTGGTGSTETANYQYAGTYSVTLTATGPGGSNSVTKSFTLAGAVDPSVPIAPVYGSALTSGTTYLSSVLVAVLGIASLLLAACFGVWLFRSRIRRFAGG